MIIGVYEFLSNVNRPSVIVFITTMNSTMKYFNPLKTKRRPLYIKAQSVPRCKHFSSRL